MTDDEATDLSITHAVHGKGGKYTADVAGKDATGTLEWERGSSENVRIATHTVVPKSIGGRGVAARLVDRLIDDAREHGFKVDPQCWYVAKKFDENPDWTNLRA